MPLAQKKLVTIIAPESGEDDLVAALAKVTRGLSIVPARGRGEHGERPNVWHSGNIQVEAVVSPAEVERVLAVLERLPTETPVVAWVSDIDAWPANKFA